MVRRRNLEQDDRPPEAIRRGWVQPARRVPRRACCHGGGVYRVGRRVGAVVSGSVIWLELSANNPALFNDPLWVAVNTSGYALLWRFLRGSAGVDVSIELDGMVER